MEPPHDLLKIQGIKIKEWRSTFPVLENGKIIDIPEYWFRKYKWTQQRNLFTLLWLKNVFQKVKYEKFNQIFIVIGESGSGKSYTSLKLAELFDPTFSIDRVIYKPSEFFEVLDDLERKPQPGYAIIWDEGGIKLDSRDWQSLSNKAVSKVLQTFRGTRSGRVFLFFTVPELEFIDKRVRKMANYILYMERHGSDVIMYPYQVIKNKPVVKYDISLRYPRIRWGKDYVILKSFKIGLPSEDLIEAYEKKAIPSKEEVRKELAELFGINIERESKEELLTRLKKEIMEDIDKFKNAKGRISADLIYYHYKDQGITKDLARVLKTVVEKEMAKIQEMTVDV